MSEYKNLKEIYDSVPYLSIKYDSYFPVYEFLLNKFRGKNITLVEVGVFNGGSLFMWREFFGPQARIIGIELNPQAKDWEQAGFEIYIGDQSSDTFWEDFYKKIGPVDILIDDGGHTNQQQIVTSHHAIQNIRDGGVLIVEDVHTNYFREFGNPYRLSFIKFANRIVDSVNSRASALKRKLPRYSSVVYSVSFYESIVAFHVDRKLCIQSSPTTNNGATKNALDFRYQSGIQQIIFNLKNKVGSARNPMPPLFNKVIMRALNLIQFFTSRLKSFEYKKYFKD